jgi:isoleucyl-tRNA synthetase
MSKQATTDLERVAGWWEGPVDEFFPPLILEIDVDVANWCKGTDTMDVWLDSGSSWSLLPSKAGW